MAEKRCIRLMFCVLACKGVLFTNAIMKEPKVLIE